MYEVQYCGVCGHECGAVVYRNGPRDGEVKSTSCRNHERPGKVEFMYWDEDNGRYISGE